MQNQNIKPCLQKFRGQPEHNSDFDRNEWIVYPPPPPPAGAVNVFSKKGGGSLKHALKMWVVVGEMESSESCSNSGVGQSEIDGRQVEAKRYQLEASRHTAAWSASS